MTQESNIANLNAVFASDKAIRSNAAGGVATWFYRTDDRDYVAFHENAGRHTVDRDTIERNIEHRDTDVETVDVGESPFDA